MTTYNTGNPLGSAAPKDLYDNAENLDLFSNGPEPFYPDRFGVQRRSLSGIQAEFTSSQAGREAQFQQFLADSAFVFIGDYAAGLNFTSRSQYMIRDGVPYRLAPGATLPYTTTGNWGTEAVNFSPINSDDVLRQDLAPADSTVQIGGVSAEDIGKLVGAVALDADGRVRVVSGKFILGNGVLVSPNDRDALSIYRTTSGNSDLHEILIKSVLTGVTDAGTRGIIDINTRLEGSNNQNHDYGLQCRMEYAGSNMLQQFAGVITRPKHTGTGAITETYGIDIGTLEITGGGTAAEQAGIRIRNQVGATVNVGINNEQATGYSTFAGGGALFYNKGRSGFGIMPSTNYALQFAGTAAGARRGFLETTATNVQIGGEGDGVTQFIQNAAVKLQIKASANGYSVTPGTDNSQTLGDASNRWSVVWAGTGTISTSDARDKTPVRKLTAAEIAAACDLADEIGAYKFLDSISEKGDAAREHIGMTVQRAMEVLESHGIDPYELSFICHDEWSAVPAITRVVELGDLRSVKTGGLIASGVESSEENLPISVWAKTHEIEVELSPARTAGDRYSFRENGLYAFIAAGMKARQDDLARRLAALEAKA